MSQEERDISERLRLTYRHNVPNCRGFVWVHSFALETFRVSPAVVALRVRCTDCGNLEITDWLETFGEV